MIKFVVYLWLTDGSEGYVVTYENWVESLYPSDAIKMATRFGSKDEAETWVANMSGYSRRIYSRHKVQQIQVQQ